MVEQIILDVYKRLYDFFGPQHWWPGETKLEVIVGAILTQNTSWQNVEKAIYNLKNEGLLSLERLHELDPSSLADLIRPSGYYNIKAKRLKAVINYFSNNSSIEGSLGIEVDRMRKELLNINGVGEETADSILLYAFNQPVFVVDAYTGRIFSRLGLIEPKQGYDVIKEFFENSLPKDPVLYNEYHALLVKLGKDFCKKQRPNCRGCPLKEICKAT